MNQKQKSLQNAPECGTIRSGKEAAPAVDPGLAYILSMTVEEKRELLEIWKKGR